MTLTPDDLDEVGKCCVCHVRLAAGKDIDGSLYCGYCERAQPEVSRLRAALSAAEREQDEASQELAGVHATLETVRADCDRLRKDIPTADAITWRRHANDQIKRAESAEAAVEKLTAERDEARDSSEAWRLRWLSVATALRDYLKMQPLEKAAETVIALDAALAETERAR